MLFYHRVILFVIIAVLLLFSLRARSQVTVKVAPPFPDTSSQVANNGTTDTITPSVVIANINVTGYKKTKPYIIAREFAFKEGEEIQENQLRDKLELTRQQLMNTSLFVDVEVKVSKIENRLVFVDVHVKERWYLFPLPYFKLIDRNLNQWWVEQKRNLNRVNYGLKFMQYNVSGRNDKLNLWLISGYTQQVSFRYENPFLDKKLKHGMNVGISHSRNHEINYKTDFNKQLFVKHPDDYLIQTSHVDLGYSYRPAIKTRHNFFVAYTHQKIHDSVVKLNPNFFKGGANMSRYIDLGYTMQHFNVDYIPYPLKGFLGEVQFHKRGINKTNNFWQLAGKGEYIVKALPKFYVHFQGIGSIRVPFDQPYSTGKLFGSGDYYLRGLEYYVIDGVAGGMLRATPKKQLLSFNVRNPIGTKTHDKIPIRVFLKGFTDAAYVYSKNPGNSFLNNKWIYTFGTGLDIITFYDVVVKLEYSYNRYEPSNKKWGFFIHTRSDF